MIENIFNANFPRDEEDRVYHLGIKQGNVANRILTVGDHVRARKIAALLDPEEETGHPIFEHLSQRGFLTITGRYKGVPVSIMAIGMGNPMMDFFIRETRASVEGTMAVIRFGSCGTLSHLAPPGAVIVPSGGYCIRRNIDYFADEQQNPELKDKPYVFSGIFKADDEMTTILADTLKTVMAPVEAKYDFVGPVLTGGLNADGCSFYSSQGRQDAAFWDDNANLLRDIITKYPKTHSLEMETSMLFHLARCARDTQRPIRAAGCMQVFADRLTNSFIGPDAVKVLEPLVGKACLDALIKVKIEDEMPVAGTVWEPANEKRLQSL
ncbi:nucleoside phosphorylase domain-containing protein [Mycotypha africana]|uniref:nucleoside phosphorylase domain-containing protein n=1 Tax=Mycotypha africana TaxID=64632 RepID=UPI002300A30E|nr:nucleoside phosphorylase domain-containing protein [Mycotypha africana]KAI8970420.1 nucleoside phosphorylase domain-containing protein [Mycotypha africana]